MYDPQGTILQCWPNIANYNVDSFLSCKFKTKHVQYMYMQLGQFVLVTTD